MQHSNSDDMQPQPAVLESAHRMVVSDLASLVDQVRKSLKVIESQIADGSDPVETLAGDVIVLDDVTPGYARAYALLQNCDAGLSIALHLLQNSMGRDARRSEHFTKEIRLVTPRTMPA